MIKQINLTVNLKNKFLNYFFKLFKKFWGNYEMALVACKNSHLSLPLGMFHTRADVPPERWLFCRLGPLQCFTFYMITIQRESLIPRDQMH